MKTFEANQFKKGSQFATAVKDVCSSISARAEQLQQLVIIATIQASKADNLDWLTTVLLAVENTHGLSGKRMREYVTQVLCTNVKWSKASQCLKKAKKGEACVYNMTPNYPWYEHNKASDSVNNVDYRKKFINAAKLALNPEKGHMQPKDLINALLEAEVSYDDLMDSLKAFSLTETKAA